MKFRRIAGLGRDVRGTSLIEMGILLPVLSMLFIGGYQLSDASACKRRVTIVSRAMADLVSQYTVLTNSQLDSILDASTQIMSPYPIASASVRVSQITTDGASKPHVSWSRAKNGTALTPGADFNLPLTMRVANTSVIYSEVSYTYTPAFGKVMSQSVFSQNLYMLPRASSTVTLNP
jgi:Flp pilus assembly protein TadG